MRKKFTITVPWHVCDKPDNIAMFHLCTMFNQARDMLTVYKQISLNEVLRIFYVCSEKQYSYRWGWDFNKGDRVDVQVIKNPPTPSIWYLKFVAYDIVD